MEFLLFFLAFILGIGNVILLRNLFQSLRSLSWQKCRARVTHISFEETSDDCEKRYHLHIRYRYTFNGLQHEGKNFNFRGKEFLTRQKSIHLHNLYSEDKEISIWVNPAKPHMSVIEAGSELVDFIFLVGCIYMFHACLLRIFGENIFVSLYKAGEDVASAITPLHSEALSALFPTGASKTRRLYFRDDS